MEKFRNIPYNDKRHMLYIVKYSIYKRFPAGAEDYTYKRKCISSGTGLRKAVKNEECI